MSNLNKPLTGIVLVNKPQGLSSNAVLQKVKRLFNAKKAGHTGSLDPLATGMLPVCFGEATKICQYLLSENKAYRATGRLGVKTNTGDSTGDIIAALSDFSIPENELLGVLQQFIGRIMQIPSMFSALKHQGVPLYKLARQGKTLEREARPVHIYKLELLDYDGEHFTIDVLCSKGTYIRNLVEDIGEVLGVGAHVTALHRPYTAGFVAEQMYTLEELNKFNADSLSTCLLPMERAVAYLPMLTLDADEIVHLQQGKTLNNKQQPPFENSVVRLFNESSQFLGLGEFENKILKVKRLLAF